MNRKKIRKKSHNQDIVEVDNLVKLYQTQNPEISKQALKELLEHFDDYFEKYVCILTGKIIDLHNKDSYRFYSLFLPHQKKDISNIIMVKKFLKNITKDLENDDIKNELICIFIDKILNKYTVFEGINFIYYMTTIFRFRVKDWCNKLANNTITLSLENSLYSSELDSSPQKNLALITEPITSTGDIDLHWVDHPTSNIFKQLTRYQRYLLYLYYSQNLTIDQLAKVIGKERDAIYSNITVIRNKVKALTNESASNRNFEPTG